MVNQRANGQLLGKIIAVINSMCDIKDLIFFHIKGERIQVFYLYLLMSLNTINYSCCNFIIS